MKLKEGTGGDVASNWQGRDGLLVYSIPSFQLCDDGICRCREDVGRSQRNSKVSAPVQRNPGATTQRNSKSKCNYDILDSTTTPTQNEGASKDRTRAKQ